MCHAIRIYLIAVNGKCNLKKKKFFFCRYNFTNSEEPYFLLESLDALNALMTSENNSLTSIIYSVNQKGRSSGMLLKDLKIGDIFIQSGEYSQEYTFLSLLPVT